VRDVVCDGSAGDDDIGGNAFGNHRLGPQRGAHGSGGPNRRTEFIIGTLVFLPLEVLALIIFWPLLLLGAILAGA
jgi:hypothetical protein